MRTLARLLYWTTALGSALANAAQAPYFLLQSETLPGHANRTSFDKQYLTLAGGLIFERSNVLAAFCTLHEAQPASNSTPALYHLDLGHNIRAQMGFGAAAYAYWEPVTFATAATNGSAQSAQLQNRFYINGTGSDMRLLWSNDRKAQFFSEFVDWLLCDWQYGHHQLFFITSDAPEPLKIPSTCARVNLRVIPIP